MAWKVDNTDDLRTIWTLWTIQLIRKMIRAQVDGVKVIMAVASHLSMASSDQRLSDRFLCGKTSNTSIKSTTTWSKSTSTGEISIQEY